MLQNYFKILFLNIFIKINYLIFKILYNIIILYKILCNYFNSNLFNKILFNILYNLYSIFFLIFIWNFLNN